MPSRPKQIKFLASDLDGTLLPLQNNLINRSDLHLLGKILNENVLPLFFVTGRPIWSVCEAIETEELPHPTTIITNVGTEIYQDSNNSFVPIDGYRQHLDTIASVDTFEYVDEELKNDPRLVRQEDNKQARHKLSFYTQQSQTIEIAGQLRQWITKNDLPLNIVASKDPFSEHGFIDFLPSGIDKNYALRWYCSANKIATESVIYAGDSGNDLAAMQSGFSVVLVSNASQELRETLLRYHDQKFGDRSRIYLASAPATSGVLEGLTYYLKIATLDERGPRVADHQ
jgi:HAD superfamily hydrolase (TIGR01484 family)